MITILAVLSLAFLNGGCQMLSPAIASLSEQFPNLPYSSITMILTIVNLLSLPVLLISGSLAGRRIRFRTICLFGTAVFAIGGIIPFFIRDSYAVIMASRVLVAIGAGCVISLPATLAFRLFTGDRAQQVQGWSNAGSSIVGALMMLLVGVLATISLDLIWLTHLLGVVSFLLVAFALPEPEKPAPVAVSEDGEKPKKDKMPVALWGLLFACVFGMVCMYPVYLNSSLIIVDNGWGDADLSGTCNALASVGSFVGGVIFGKFYSKFPHFTPLFCTILAAVGCLSVFLAPSYVLLVIGAFLTGWGFMQFFCYIMGVVGIIVPPSLVAFAMSCVLVANNLGVFAAPYCSTFFQFVMGTATYQPIFVIYAILWLAMGVVMFLWHPDKKALTQES